MFSRLSQIKVITSIAVLLFVGLVSLFLYFIPSGRIEAEQDFQGYSYRISDIGPVSRVIELGGSDRVMEFHDVKAGRRTVFAEPVYFSVRAPRNFKKANVGLKYQTNYPNLKIGVKVGEADDAYYFEELNAVKPTLFDLEAVPRFDGRYHFAISAPGMYESGQELVIDEIDVLLEGEPLPKY